jgi:general L-amino acid transport system permease protein
MEQVNNKSSDKIPFWRDPRKLAWVYQIVTVAIVGGLVYYLFSNTQANLERQAIATGFDFLEKESSFEIGESLIPYSAADTYARALLVGVLNTLKVSFIGVIITVIIGTFIGIARLSSNWLVSKLSGLYIEIMQDIPVLLHLFFWYAIFYDNFPSPRAALSPFEGLYLTNRGLIMAVPQHEPIHKYILLVFILGIAASWLLKKWSDRRHDLTGKTFPVGWASLGLIIGLPIITWLLAGAPLKMDIPELKGFNFRGGVTMSPEFTALLMGLVFYTSAFVAEIVRAGIQSVGKGQVEAAKSLGLGSGQILRLVILPQALRVIIPPLTSQMLNLTKNSTLAVAIGYPDFVSVANTTINQTGQAIEGVALIMAVYLVFSLGTSAFMNWYNKRSALVER